MKLKEGNELYVRIDYKAGEKEETEQDALDSMAYSQKISKERYLLAGLFGEMETGKIDGAMLIFEAKDFEEAEKIAYNDPIIERGFYRCELHKWNIVLSSEGIVEQ
jgi:YCII-related domain.